MTDKQKLRLVMSWVGRLFPDQRCPFCGRHLVTEFHRSTCVLYRRERREWKERLRKSDEAIAAEVAR